MRFKRYSIYELTTFYRPHQYLTCYFKSIILLSVRVTSNFQNKSRSDGRLASEAREAREACERVVSLLQT